MKLTKKNRKKLDLLGDGDWPDVDSCGASITEELQTLGLAETYPHPDFPDRRMVRITEKGRAHLNGEDVISDRRQGAMEDALKALRLVISLHALTTNPEPVMVGDDALEGGGLVPKVGPHGERLCEVNELGEEVGLFHAVDLDPKALEQVEAAAEALAEELKLIF